eukprot:3515246-Rhodomonas_salina.1
MGVTGEVEVGEDGGVLGGSRVPYSPHLLFLHLQLLPALCVLQREKQGLDCVEDEGSEVGLRVD